MFEIDYQSYVKISSAVHFPNSLLQPIMTKTFFPLLVRKVEIGRNPDQIFTWNNLWHFAVEKFDFGRPHICSIVQDNKESIIAACKLIQGFPCKVEFVYFSIQALFRNFFASASDDFLSFSLDLSLVSKLALHRILCFVISGYQPICIKRQIHLREPSCILIFFSALFPQNFFPQYLKNSKSIKTCSCCVKVHLIVLHCSYQKLSAEWP